MDKDQIRERIPHRDPFLWLDRVVEIDGQSIRAEKDIPLDLDIFQGHYPNYPIMPGVLLCEAIFQAGAVLTSYILGQSKGEEWQEQSTEAVPVLTRILGAKFKREVRPGDRIELRAVLKEQVGPAWFFKGSALVGGKVAVKIEFSCMLKE
ncbi:MAG: 3-hydroxyacyl-ACP dehydratase FabZ [Desulfobulbaceae bacterium]|nr:3-hydroxyacyl-ACP dehydratase FabZ [Desulfobulbaceae bacterium]